MTMVDTIRAVATYLIAFVTVIGGGAMIFALRGDPNAKDIIAIAASFIGAALTFVFGQEVQTRTARQAAASTFAAHATAVTNGAQAPTPPVES
jgi:hypothetical protein